MSAAILRGFLSSLDSIECLVADPGLPLRQNYMLAAEKGGTPYIKPKKNSQMNAKGCWPWKNMIVQYRRHPRIFNRLYRLRQRVEAGWHSLKSLVGDLIRNKTNHKNRNLVKNSLLQPHMDNQRKS